MKKILSFLFVALLCTTTAFAYDHLITNDTAMIGKAGSMTAQAALMYTTASKGDVAGDEVDYNDNATNMFIPLKFRYVIMDNLEAFGVLPFEKWDMGDFGESGIGDLWVGAKYGLMPEGVLTLRGALDIPLGDDKKGLGETGGFGIDVGAMTEKQLSSIKVDAQVGVRYNVEDSDTKIQPGIGVYIDGEGSYALSEVLSAQLGVEIMYAGKSKWDGNDLTDSDMNSIELNVGAKYTLAENMGLKGDILYNVAGKNSDRYFGVLIAYCYGF